MKSDARRMAGRARRGRIKTCNDYDRAGLWAGQSKSGRENRHVKGERGHRAKTRLPWTGARAYHVGVRWADASARST